MLTRKLTLLVFLSFICFMGFAQNNNMDEVYLNNGSIFKGEIVEYKLGDELTFKLGDEQILVFNDKDILKIIQADGTVINPATANADIKEDAVTMDAATRRNLEIDTNLTGGESNTLFELLNTASTCMGSRLLCRWLNRPLRNRQTLELRQQGAWQEAAGPPEA